MIFLISSNVETLASDFSPVFDLFRCVLLAPFFALGGATGVILGSRISAGRGKALGYLLFGTSVLGTAFLFTWIGNAFIRMF